MMKKTLPDGTVIEGTAEEIAEYEKRQRGRVDEEDDREETNRRILNEVIAAAGRAQ